jgi:hypothetical protein
MSECVTFGERGSISKKASFGALFLWLGFVALLRGAVLVYSICVGTSAHPTR